MRIVQDWRHLDPTLKGAAIALGNFDGVHLGHAGLIRALHTARPDLPAAVLTFEPHPREFFRSDDPPFRLTLSAARAELLATLGISTVIELGFDAAFSAMTAQQFMDVVLGSALGARHLCCGPDFAFGNRRGGDIASLSTWSESAGVGLTVVPTLSDAQGQISSTRIRRLLQDGYPERAAGELGRPWSVRGVVMHGEARGRTIGFPTANVPLGRHLEPARGVYAVSAHTIDGSLPPLAGVANIGRRPTVNAGQESRLEVHVFDWSGDLYGREIGISLHHFLRAERKFASFDELRAQIMLDAVQARTLQSLA